MRQSRTPFVARRSSYETSLAAAGDTDGGCAGPDGNVWFVSYASDLVERSTTSGTITQYALQLGARPRSLTAGPDGALWIAEEGTDSLGRLTTAGALQEYGAGAGITPGANVRGVTTGPDGNIWFTEFNGNRVGKFVL